MEHVVEVRRSIRASREAVWAALAELPQWHSWDPYIASVRRVDGGGAGAGPHWSPGARWVERVRRGPFRPTFQLTVTAVCAGASCEWQTRYLWVTVVHRWTVQDHAAGCEVVSRERFQGPAPVIGIAKGLFRAFGVERMTRRSLAALADHVERDDG